MKQSDHSWTYGISFLVLAFLLRLNVIYLQLVVLSERIIFPQCFIML